MQQLDLFGSKSEPKPWDYFGDFLSKEEADTLLVHCQQLDWQQFYTERFGFRTPNPRLECLYGKKGIQYSYGAITLESVAPTKLLQTILQRVSAHTAHQFDYLIGNMYRGADDSISWHADTKDAACLEGAIASLSLGQMRLFQIKENQQGAKIESIWLEHGSLLVMHPRMQRTHVHRVPKVTKGWCGERINLTFRPWNN